MSSSCSHHPPTAAKSALLFALALNLSLFIIEIWQGLTANSTALLADAMDFLADSFSYGFTLYVLTHPLRTRAKASLLKAGLMLALAAFVAYEGIHNALAATLPHAATMAWVSLLALAANLLSAAALYRSRGQDSNMRSIWLCSRNDAINNLLVLAAAATVSLTLSPWPDLAIALLIAALGTHSALTIIREARKELNPK